MAQPSPVGLSDVMKTQHKLVDEMLFRTIELTALVDAGQHRFLGRALDDLERVERQLGQAELVRSAMTEAILGSKRGAEPTLSELLSAVDDDTAAAISGTAADIRSGLARVEQIRSGAITTAAERVRRTRNALNAATSDTGLYGRA